MTMTRKQTNVYQIDRATPHGPKISQALIEQDPYSHSSWVYDIDTGLRWAQQGVFVLIKGFPNLLDATRFASEAQPYLYRPYGRLTVAALSGAWDAHRSLYHAFGVLRTVADYETADDTLYSPFLVQPWFVSVKDQIATTLPLHRVAESVDYYRQSATV